MTAPVFVDANVLVYARDAGHEGKHAQANAWLAFLWESRRGRLSFQVLHEYYVTVTSKLKPGMSREAARHDIRDLLSWRPVPLEGALLAGAWLVQDRHRISFGDALVVSAAHVSSCRYLLTEDLQDGQRFGPVEVMSPFRHGPEAVG